MKHCWQKEKILKSKHHQEKIFASVNGNSYIKKNNKQVLLDDGKYYTEFMSCSYLGIDVDHRLTNNMLNEMDNAGMLFSASRTRLKYHGLDKIEELLNEIFSAKTIIFSSTHLTHLGIIPLLASGELPNFPIKEKLIFFLDKTAHASIQINIGLMQQFGEVHKVDLRDFITLKKILEDVVDAKTTIILMCDSVGSMGNLFPIKELYYLTKKLGGYLYLDDAHGMSSYGKYGGGYVLEQFNEQLPEDLILITSLAKAFGTYGGVVVLKSLEAIDFIRKYCSTYIFSGSMVTPLITASIESAKIHLSSEIIELQAKLRRNINLFDKMIRTPERIINYGLDVPIRALKVGNELETIEVAKKLKESGILATAAIYPTTSLNNGIIRFSICANHIDKDIYKLCNLIKHLT